MIARADLTRRQAEQLATAGAFDQFGHDRRQALWVAGYPGSSDQLDVPIDAKPPQLPGMTGPEVTAADLAATRIAPDQHPIAHLRGELDRHGIVPIARIGRDLDRRRITVAGHVTHRQRPGTAGGVTFLNLEDETGMLNIVCSTATWQRYRRTVKGTNTLLIRGIAEWGDGALNLLADKIAPLTAILPASTRHRDPVPGLPMTTPDLPRRFVVRQADDGTWGVWDTVINAARSAGQDQARAEQHAADLELQFDAWGPRPAPSVRPVRPADPGRHRRLATGRDARPLDPGPRRPIPRPPVRLVRTSPNRYRHLPVAARRRSATGSAIVTGQHTGLS